MAASKPGYNVEADRTTNTLYIELAGRMEPEAIERAAEEAVAAAESLSEGFYIINDISEFMPPSPEAAKPIQRAQSELKEMGVGDVVRVVADETSAVTENAFQRRSRKAGYEGKTAHTVDEAEAMLH
jgi:sensor histidine kinase regulating citrate/malate metabolism